MNKVIRPQKGPQEKFLATTAEIAIYGGAAGGGKTYAILMEPLRYIYTKGYRAVIFRKNFNQIFASGGIWDESREMYSDISGAKSVQTPKFKWSFKNMAHIYFDFLGRDADVEKWQGSQITFIGFDELTHFTERQFFYMMSRNRSTCGVRPYIRATCNPDADSWVAKFIEWWINPETGYPIPERSGKKRYMARIEADDNVIWADTRQELLDKGIAPEKVKSVTFIASTLEDNKILMEKDPGYKANLESLPLVERERLLHGNWKIKAAAGMFFKRVQIGEILPTVPEDLVAIVRGWDLAATDVDENEDAAYTAGVLMAKRSNGRFVVIDVINQQLKAGDVRKLIKTTTVADNAKYGYMRQRLPQDPGQAGKEQAESYIAMLAGYDVVTKQESGSKQTRAEPMAAQWQIKDGKILCGTRDDDGTICGPGGHVEDGEPPDRTATREAQEEFSITPLYLLPLGHYKGSTGRYLPSTVYFTDQFTGDPVADEDEMHNARWLTLRELENETLFPPFAESLNMLKNSLTSMDQPDTIKSDGGPGSGRYPKGSGKKNSGTGRERKKSLPMTTVEKAKVTHDINNLYHAKFKGKRKCFIRTRSNEPDSPTYTYRFANHGFNDYDIYSKEWEE